MNAILCEVGPNEGVACQACGRRYRYGMRTGLITARVLCHDCGQVEADISVEQMAQRIKLGIEVGQRLLARRTG